MMDKIFMLVTVSFLKGTRKIVQHSLTEHVSLVNPTNWLEYHSLSEQKCEVVQGVRFQGHFVWECVDLHGTKRFISYRILDLIPEIGEGIGAKVTD